MERESGRERGREREKEREEREEKSRKHGPNQHLVPPTTTSETHGNTSGAHNKPQVGPTHSISGAHSKPLVGSTNNHKCGPQGQITPIHNYWIH